MVNNKTNDVINNLIAQHSFDKNVKQPNIGNSVNIGNSDNIINSNKDENHDNDSGSEQGKNKNTVKLIQLGIVITLSLFTALAWNECIRYYIGRSIKFYNGRPEYYVYYSLCISFITFIIYLYCFLQK